MSHGLHHLALLLACLLAVQHLTALPVSGFLFRSDGRHCAVISDQGSFPRGLYVMDGNNPSKLVDSGLPSQVFNASQLAFVHVFRNKTRLFLCCPKECQTCASNCCVAMQFTTSLFKPCLFSSCCRRKERSKTSWHATRCRRWICQTSARRLVLRLFLPWFVTSLAISQSPGFPVS